MKLLVLCEIVTLLVIGFQSRNTVSDDASPAPQNEGTTEMPGAKSEPPNEQSALDNQTLVQNKSDTSPPDSNGETSANKSSIADSQPEAPNSPIKHLKITLQPTARQNETDGSSFLSNYSEENDATMKEEQIYEKTINHKSVAMRISTKPYNNSFVLTNLLNLSRDKNNVKIIGEPVDLTEFIKNMKFKSDPIVFHEKVTNFGNISASVIPSNDQVHTYYNNFTCTSQYFGILLDVIPENMTFEGNYTMKDQKTNETSNGTFVMKQTGARLSYKISNVSEFHISGHNLTKYGDLIYGNGQIKFTQLCDNQCDLLATSAEMFNNTKYHMLEKLNESFISRPMDEFISTFPFLSICSPSPSTRPPSNRSSNYYVINETVALGKNNPTRLLLGPMILKGLDNFTSGNVVAIKGPQPKAPNRFILSTQVNYIQGQCDWRYVTNKSAGHSSLNHSFTFIIEQIKFTIGVQFSQSESWNVDDLKIHIDGISIHRLDKRCPKILTFIKMMLEDFVKDAVRNSLTEMFSRYFPEMRTTPKITVKTKTTGSRQVIHWTEPFYPMDMTDVTTGDRNHLPFPTRKVLKQCKDTRKWWQKLFYRNKCKNRVVEDD